MRFLTVGPFITYYKMLLEVFCQSCSLKCGFVLDVAPFWELIMILISAVYLNVWYVPVSLLRFMTYMFNQYKIPERRLSFKFTNEVQLSIVLRLKEVKCLAHSHSLLNLYSGSTGTILNKKICNQIIIHFFNPGPPCFPLLVSFLIWGFFPPTLSSNTKTGEF